MENNFEEIFKAARKASRVVNTMSETKRNKILERVIRGIEECRHSILHENYEDLHLMDSDNPLYDRLKLTSERLDEIIANIRTVAALPCPIGEIIDGHTLPNGLQIRKVRVPYGVIGVIYEARPNVTFDVFALCLKSGNACVLKGGSDADRTNKEIVRMIRCVLSQMNIDPNIITLLPSTHEATAAMLGAVGYIDVCIPRGGRRLIDFVRDNARIPVIETGAGVVHAYFDKDGDLKIGAEIISNAKLRRVSVCNALDTLLVHRDRIKDLPYLCAEFWNMDIFVDEEASTMLNDHAGFLECWEGKEEYYSKEWMDYKMNIKIVGSLDEALEHIATYGSGHSECIITENMRTAERFQREVDAACVYVNAPTSFTDGAQFGLGAEIGISTQKLGPRGPMGLREITTYRYLINGCGQTRP
ncbi:MAG: glutamate-5-semialdehyde dehydrogenase [Staphylococcus sp.]|nr:glutamate-5-semialdehyde dehydrogenase [Staphylococcus sp.]